MPPTWLPMILRPVRVGILLCVLSAAASATLINFEDLSISPGSYTFSNPVISQGYSLSASDGGYELDADGAYRGSISFFTDSTPIGLARVGGGAFNLLSFWAAEDNLDTSRTISLTGFLAGGGTVSADFVLDGVYDGPGGDDDYQQFILPGTFVGLSGVSFSDPLADLSLDDITVETAVPEPSTFALAGAVLLAAGLRRHGGTRRSAHQARS
jgi:hypothetical protein